MSFQHLRRGVSAAAATVALAAALPAQAAYIDFAGVFEAFGPGQASSSYDDASGNRFIAAGGDALIDFSFCSAPDFCALGNTTEFLQAYNDAVITLTSRSGGAQFSLTGFDASFLPTPSIDFGGAQIGLRITGAQAGGGAPTLVVPLVETLVLGGGDWVFTTYQLSGFDNLTSVSFEACFFNGPDCERPTGVFLNDAQFALDNIGTAPEPGSIALTLASLLALAAAARRRAR